MKKKFFFISLFLCFVYSYAQHKSYTYTAHISLEQAIYINSEIVEGRTLFFEKQAAKKPLMFQKTKVRLGELNRIANNLSKFIVSVQKEVNKERVLFELLEQGFYRDLIFKPNGKLTKKGGDLKVKIDSLYDCALGVNVHKLSQLDNFTYKHFKTDTDYYDYDENKLDYFHYTFYDKSNYGMMMAMNYLLLDVKLFQLLYYGTIMSY